MFPHDVHPPAPCRFFHVQACGYFLAARPLVGVQPQDKGQNVGRDKKLLRVSPAISQQQRKNLAQRHRVTLFFGRSLAQFRGQLVAAVNLVKIKIYVRLQSSMHLYLSCFIVLIVRVALSFHPPRHPPARAASPASVFQKF